MSMINAVYYNRYNYYQLLEQYLNEQLTVADFQAQFMQLRTADFANNKQSGYLNSARILDYVEYQLPNESTSKERGQALYSFKKMQTNSLFDKARAKDADSVALLFEYEQQAIEHDIKGEFFYMGLWNFVDEYVRDYHPDDESFNKWLNVDEQTLRAKAQATYEILTNHYARWQELVLY